MPLNLGEHVKLNPWFPVACRVLFFKITPLPVGITIRDVELLVSKSPSNLDTRLSLFCLYSKPEI